MGKISLHLITDDISVAISCIFSLSHGHTCTETHTHTHTHTFMALYLFKGLLRGPFGALLVIIKDLKQTKRFGPAELEGGLWVRG
jgi:hypothetical protein